MALPVNTENSHSGMMFNLIVPTKTHRAALARVRKDSPQIFSIELHIVTYPHMWTKRSRTLDRERIVMNNLQVEESSGSLSSALNALSLSITSNDSLYY